MKVIITAFLFLLCSVTICFSQEKKEIDWKSDIEYLIDTLTQKHINIFFNTKEYEFNKQLDAILVELPELTDLQVAIKIQQVIANMGDSHTNAGWAKFISNDKNIGIGTYKFKDGLYITSANQRDSILLGKKIVSIGGLDIQEVVDGLKTMFVNENEALTKSLVPLHLIYSQLLNYFGCVSKVEGFIEFEVSDETNQVFKHQIKLGAKDTTVYSSISSKPLLYGSNDWFTAKYDDKNDIYFVQYNRCDSKELAIEMSQPQDIIDKKPSIEEFKQKVYKTVSEKPIKKFVFDMRYNGGGSSTQGTEFIEDLSHIKKINQEGKLFVLIGRETFSSAIINTLDFQLKTKAILVGEETGGKASHFGETRSFRLPSSGLKITYSTKYFYCNKKNQLKVFRTNKGINTEKDKRKTITPDYIVELSFDNFQNNVDPVVKWIEQYDK
jgi:hypothetical protein